MMKYAKINLKLYNFVVFMKREVGIILKTLFPKKLKMVILDRQLGKIECVPPSDNYRMGSMLEYTMTAWGSVYMLQEVSVIDVPLIMGARDINFLHHMLELAYFCAPFNQMVEGFYDLLCELYHYIPVENHDTIKLAYAFKGTHLLGLHPDELQGKNYELYQLAEKPIDTIVDKALNLDFKEEIKDWVHHSLKNHPLHTYFKTRFFHEIGSQ